jgi:dsRNA-specific ribonuclease
MTFLNQYNDETIYLGPRGVDFRDLIYGLLKKGNLKPKYIKSLTTDESMEEFSKAFTSETADKYNNCEVFEQLGDLSANKFIVTYMYKRFPKLNCTKGVKVVARLRINYGSKQSFFKIAQDLGFWSFVSASRDERQRRMKPLLEDCLEAFLGCVECLLDERFRIGVGYAIVYDILESIFDDMSISLAYEDLYDPKTRLKELFDHHKAQLGQLKYREEKKGSITKSVVSQIIKKNVLVLGTGSASLKSDAQQKAAVMALKYLNSKGFTKPIPKIYTEFCKK